MIRKSTLSRILIVMFIMLLLIHLSGCRKRISNNTRVEPVAYDNEGYITELYDMRRDELGLSVAEKPFINLLKPDENQDNDFDEDPDFDDYDESLDDWDDEDDLDTDDDTYDTTTPTTTTPTTPSTGVTRPTTSTTTVQPLVRVTFDANGGSSSATIANVRKGSAYGSLPTATRDGYKFKGWYTAKKKGKKVTATTKVTNGNAHTLYARWEKKAQKKKYTVSFDANADGDTVVLSSDSITIAKGDTFGSMPTAKRSGYSFDGWYTEPDGGKRVKKGDKFSAGENMTLYAHWTYDPYASWEKVFKEQANSVADEMPVIYDSDNKKAASLIKDCRGEQADEPEKAAYVIVFIDDYSDSAAEEAAEAAKETYPDTSVIVVPTDAYSGDDESKLAYKLMLLDAMHGAIGEEDIEKATEELGVNVFTLYVS